MALNKLRNLGFSKAPFWSLDIPRYLGDALLTAAANLDGLPERVRRDALVTADRRDILGQKG
jgi:hypothetical protein